MENGKAVTKSPNRATDVDQKRVILVTDRQEAPTAVVGEKKTTRPDQKVMYDKNQGVCHRYIDSLTHVDFSLNASGSFSETKMIRKTELARLQESEIRKRKNMTYDKIQGVCPRYIKTKTKAEDADDTSVADVKIESTGCLDRDNMVYGKTHGVCPKYLKCFPYQGAIRNTSLHIQKNDSLIREHSVKDRFGATRLSQRKTFVRQQRYRTPVGSGESRNTNTGAAKRADMTPDYIPGNVQSVPQTQYIQPLSALRKAYQSKSSPTELTSQSPQTKNIQTRGQKPHETEPRTIKQYELSGCKTVTLSPNSELKTDASFNREPDGVVVEPHCAGSTTFPVLTEPNNVEATLCDDEVKEIQELNADVKQAENTETILVRPCDDQQIAQTGSLTYVSEVLQVCDLQGFDDVSSNKELSSSSREVSSAILSNPEYLAVKDTSEAETSKDIQCEDDALFSLSKNNANEFDSSMTLHSSRAEAEGPGAIQRNDEDSGGALKNVGDTSSEIVCAYCGSTTRQGDSSATLTALQALAPSCESKKKRETQNYFETASSIENLENPEAEEKQDFENKEEVNKFPIVPILPGEHRGTITDNTEIQIGTVQIKDSSTRLLQETPSEIQSAPNYGFQFGDMSVDISISNSLGSQVTINDGFSSTINDEKHVGTNTDLSNELNVPAIAVIEPSKTDVRNDASLYANLSAVSSVPAQVADSNVADVKRKELQSESYTIGGVTAESPQNDEPEDGNATSDVAFETQENSIQPQKVHFSETADNRLYTAATGKQLNSSIKREAGIAVAGNNIGNKRTPFLQKVKDNFRDQRVTGKMVNSQHKDTSVGAPEKRLDFDKSKNDNSACYSSLKKYGDDCPRFQNVQRFLKNQRRLFVPIDSAREISASQVSREGFRGKSSRSPSPGRRSKSPQPIPPTWRRVDQPVKCIPMSTFKQRLSLAQNREATFYRLERENVLYDRNQGVCPKILKGYTEELGFKYEFQSDRSVVKTADETSVQEEGAFGLVVGKDVQEPTNAAFYYEEQFGTQIEEPTFRTCEHNVTHKAKDQASTPVCVFDQPNKPLAVYEKQPFRVEIQVSPSTSPSELAEQQDTRVLCTRKKSPGPHLACPSLGINVCVSPTNLNDVDCSSFRSIGVEIKISPNVSNTSLVSLKIDDIAD